MMNLQKYCNYGWGMKPDCEYKAKKRNGKKLIKPRAGTMQQGYPIIVILPPCS
jgi:hypothetical protein